MCRTPTVRSVAVGVAMCAAASLSACTPVLEEASVAVVISEVIPTVATVTATTRVAARVYVEYGRGLEYELATPLTDALTAEHELDVIGLTPGTRWHYRLVVVIGAREFAGEDHTVDTPPAPSDLPEVDVLADQGDAWGAWTLTSFSWLQEGSLGGAVVFDDAGEPAWYWAHIGDHVHWAELSSDRRSVIALATGTTLDSPSRIVYLGLDGRTVEQIEAPLAHHSVAQVGVGGARLAYIGSVVQEWDGESVVGDRVVEVAEDGTEREVWNAFERLEVTRHAGWNLPAAGGADWTHGNGLFYDPESDAYFLSLFHLGMVVKIDRITGETVWILGGDKSDFTFRDDEGAEDEGFAHQHAPEVHGDTIYLFDNRTAGASRAVAYRLDTADWAARPVWQWETPEGSHVGVLGDVDLLENGQVLSAWGDLGQLAIVDADGTLRRRLDAEVGVLFGNAHRLTTLYPEE